MAAKEIAYQENARTLILNGVNALANAVRDLLAPALARPKPGD